VWRTIPISFVASRSILPAPSLATIQMWRDV
jgi:hypothetical protein